MKPLTALLGSILLAATLTVSAEEGALSLERAPPRRLDVESLQRGARNFVNYCLGCHSAQYMRYNRLTDLAISEKDIRDNLMFATDKVGSTMNSGISKGDATAWFGTVPPDLPVEAPVPGVYLC